jgi:hypothetical protein
VTAVNFTTLPIDGLRADILEFGFGELPDAIEPSRLTLMREEAARELSAATSAEKTSGPVTYRARMAALGPHATSFLNDPDLPPLMSRVLDTRVVVTDELSCFTYYGAGHYLGPHRDQPPDKCHLTMIVYLIVEGPTPLVADAEPVLNIFGREEGSFDVPRKRIVTRAGALVLGYGAQFWHERPMLKTGEFVAAITSCWHLAV